MKKLFVCFCLDFSTYKLAYKPKQRGPKTFPLQNKYIQYSKTNGVLL